jgi:hypothetical protein
MTHVTTITLKLNLADEEGTILTNTASMARLAAYLQTIIPTLDTLQCADAINVTEICMESCISGIWIVENERMGYELVTTYHYEIEISVRHIGQCLSNSIISRMVGAILEAGADASYVSEENLDTSYHVSYPVDWFATQSPSLLIDDREAVGYCEWDDRDTGTGTDTDTGTQDDDDEDDVSECNACHKRYTDYEGLCETV